MQTNAQKLVRNLGTGLILLLVALLASHARAEIAGNTRQFMPMRDAIPLARAESSYGHITAINTRMRSTPHSRFLSLGNTTRPQAAIPLAKAGKLRAAAKETDRVTLASLDMDSASPLALLPSRLHLAQRKNRLQPASGTDSRGQAVWPVAEAHTQISSPFGTRIHPVTGEASFHEGIDIPAPVGTSIVAVMEGEVTETGIHPLLGRYVRLEHGDGSHSLYGHLQKITVQKGDHVSTGEEIARSGNTGRTTGPHLHFALVKDGKEINPMSLLRSARTLAREEAPYHPSHSHDKDA